MEWISVKDRLPRYGRNYLVFVCGIDIAGYNNYRNTWIIPRDNEVYPTHWMELPEAPEGE